MRSASVVDVAPRLATRTRPEAAFAIEVATLAEAEASWRVFETESLASPYQRFDWVAAYVAALDDPATIRVVSVRDAGGRLVLLFAARRSRRFGLRIATPIGRKHANFNLPLMEPRLRDGLGPDGMAALMRRLCRALAVDVVSFPNCPTHWGGAANPLAAGAVQSPSNAYRLALGSDPDAAMAAASSSHARKKLRSKERGLAKLGRVAFVQAKTPEEVDGLLAAFFEQKRQRFQSLGIADPYEPQAAQAFVRGAALAGLDEGLPAIEIYALTLDDRIIAVLGGAADRGRLSAMFISFDAQGEEARFSPGEILVSHVIAAQCRRGRTVFDLGIGEARYKQTFCSEIEELVDVVVATTFAGHLYAALSRRGIVLKRALKQTPWVMRALVAVRKRGAGASPT